MNHLTTTEIIDFVSINKIDDNSLNLASKVNGHILKCDDWDSLRDELNTIYTVALSDLEIYEEI